MFANWLNNGQPTGTEDATTEDGTYTLTPTGIANNTVIRNATGTWAVTSENEWYKAAYYNPATGSYYEYATQSNTAPSNVLSATGTNNANYFVIGPGYTDPTNRVTPVGAFASSPSVYGTYDQTGDVNDWNDTILSSSPFGVGGYRGLRGGSFASVDTNLQSGYRSYNYATTSGSDYGFRVSQVPGAWLSLGILGFLGMVGLLVRRRRAKVSNLKTCN